MELDQIERRVQWLDDERRKDKNSIARLEEQINDYEARISAALQQNEDLRAELTHLKTTMGRMDQYDETLMHHRMEYQKEIKAIENQTAQRDNEMMSVLRAEIHTYEPHIEEMQKELSLAREVKKEMGARIAEENRLARLIDGLKNDLIELRRTEEDQSRVYRLIEDGRRQDAKKLTDLQGEIAALRKRYEEHRGKVDINEIAIRKLETRLNELIITEQDRGIRQEAFQEKQALLEVERDATWKEWKARFATIEKQSVDVEAQIQNLDATYLAVKRTQDAVDDLIGRVERRINEVAEIQRLAEERFRQEWTTFKADDQKRWTNYTLSQDEQRSEISRRFERLTERITYFEDNLQEIQDSLVQVNELNARSISSLLAAVHEWASSYERAGLSG
jgi:chromosome segregation ATPase